MRPGLSILFLLALSFALASPERASAKARVARFLANEAAQIKSIKAGAKTAAQPNVQALSKFVRTNNLGMWLLNFYFDPHQINAKQAEERLAAAGAKGTESCLSLNIVQAWAKPEQIDALANVPGITFIGLPRPGYHKVGQVTTEGDQVMRADQARVNYGLTGQGTKVGVISDGTESNAAAKLSGDIPSNIYIRPPVYDIQVTEDVVEETVFETVIVTSGTQPNITTVSVLTSHVVTKIVITTETTLLEGGPGEGDEGTAMMEIVHDLAPNAELGFAPGIRSDVEFINAVNDLADNFKADVIVDDIGFFTEPVYEAGPIALACQQASAFKKVNYFTAAGNQAMEHYNSVFIPSQLPNLPGTTGYLHDFGNGHNYMDLGYNGSGQDFVFAIYWNDPFNAPVSSFKLHIYITKNQKPEVAESINMSEIFYDHPVAAEVIGVTIFGFPNFGQQIVVAVEKEYGPASHFTILLLPDSNEFSQVMQRGSIFGHAGIPEVNTVGAVYQGEPDLLEPYSSQGPSTVYYPFFVNRSKPDFVAPDGVSVTGVNFITPFFGTSAAAPHAAGVAALMLEANPTLTPPGLKNLMQQSAIRLSAEPFSYRTGWGRVDALNAIAAAKNKVREWAVYE